MKLKLAIMALAAICSTVAHAGETGHYVNGIEGIKAGSVPPPGVYWRSYNVYYSADRMMDGNGEGVAINFDLDVFATSQRFIWITEKKILGASYGMDVVIPLVNTDISIGALSVDESKFGLGDIFIEPLVLAWHQPKFDAAVGLGFFAPTGDFDVTRPSSPGKGMWTFMMTAGGTYYFDEAKTWSASILARYEIHSDKDDVDLTPGDDFHFEWGVGKALGKGWEFGVAGYCHWQVSDDSGSDAAPSKVKDRVYAIGPEINGAIPNVPIGLSFRLLWEFGAKDRSEGMIGVLTATYRF